METISPESLIKFNHNCHEHMQSFKKIKGYHFNSDPELIQKCLKDYFVGGVFFDQDDLHKYVVEGSFVIGIDFTDELLTNWKYVFDAFNVYWYGAGNKYNRDVQLTKKWRNIMKEAYPDSTYTLDLRIFLENERQQHISEINEKYNAEINNI